MNPIRLRRVTIDLSAEEVAKRCGWSISHQSNIENGKIMLEREQMLKLKDVLGLDFSNFIRETHEHV